MSPQQLKYNKNQERNRNKKDNDERFMALLVSSKLLKIMSQQSHGPIQYLKRTSHMENHTWHLKPKPMSDISDGRADSFPLNAIRIHGILTRSCSQNHAILWSWAKALEILSFPHQSYYAFNRNK